MGILGSMNAGKSTLLQNFILSLDKIIKKIDRFTDNEINSFWETYSYTSKFSKQRRGKKDLNYQHYSDNNNILSKFSVDLLTLPETIRKSSKKGQTASRVLTNYVLVCICNTSRYLFKAFLNTKEYKDMKEGFIALITKIHQLKRKIPYADMNESLIFYSDYGQEFLHKELQQYLKEKNCFIYPIGMAGISKCAFAESAIKNIQMKIAPVLNDLTSVGSYKIEMRKIIRIINNSYHSAIDCSPQDYISQKNPPTKPWELTLKSKIFKYQSNKDQIQKNLVKIKKTFKINQAVRLFNKPEKFSKKTHFSHWTSEIFFIDGYKILLTSEESIGLYLCNRLGERIKGITYGPNLKKVSLPKYQTIKKIWQYITKTKKIRVSFKGFPATYYKDINFNDFSDFIISKPLRKKLKEYQEKYDKL